MKHFGGALCFALALPSFGCGEDMNTSDTESSDGGNALPPIETCNFVDDDGDGLVDEGFPWVVEDPVLLHRVSRFSTLGQVVPAADNTWILVGTDAISAPGDRLFALSIDEKAQVIHGPTHVAIPHCSQGAAVLAPLDSNFLALTGSRTWEGQSPCPEDGCPLLGVIFDPELHVVTKASLTIPNSPYPLVSGLECVFSACFAIVRDGMTVSLLRLAPSPLALEAQREVGQDAVLLSVSADDEQLLDIVDVENARVRWRRLQGQDLTEEGPPMELLAANRIHGAKALEDGGFILAYADSAEMPHVARFEADLQRRFDRSDVVPPLDMVGRGNGILYMAIPTDNLVLAVELTRLDESFFPVRAPNNPLRVNTYPSKVSLMIGENSALMFSSNYDGQAIEAHRLSCGKQSP